MGTKLKIIVAFLLLLFAIGIKAATTQAKTIDSLVQALDKISSDKEKVALLNEIAKKYISNNTDSARKYNDQAEILARKTKDKAGQALAFLNRGVIEYYASNYVIVLQYELEALRLFKELNDEKSMAKAYSNIALSYYAQSNYQEALKYHNYALALRMKIKDQEGLADSYTNIGVVHYKEGALSKALNFHLKAKTIREADAALIMGRAVTYNHIGNIYRDQNQLEDAASFYKKAQAIYQTTNDQFGLAIAYANNANIAFIRKSYDEALSLYEKALTTFETIGNKVNVAKTKNEIGVLYELKNEKTKALKNFTDALTLRLQISDKAGIANSYNNLGILNNSLGNYAIALKFLNLGKQTALESKNLAELKIAFRGLAETHAALGNYKQAYAYHLDYSNLQDTLRSITVDKQITEYLANEKKLEQEKIIQKLKSDRELKATEARRQQALTYSFVGGFVLLLAFSIVLYTRFRLIRHQKIVIEDERQRSEDLLLNILPGEVANELKEKGRSTAKSFESVTVMFTDIKNFTKMAEKLKPEEVVAEIDFYFKAFDNIIGKYGLEKIKTIGDAYMCAGGLPVPNASNPFDMINAAFEIQDFMQRTKEERLAVGQAFLEIRIGMHTGPVVAGIVGLKKFAYDIWGDTVNIAARMETASETGMINISGATYNLIKDYFTCEYRGKIEVKNKGLLDMYFVLTKKSSMLSDFEQLELHMLKKLSDGLSDKLYYHGLHHTKDVINVVSRMANAEGLSPKELELLKVAAYFHDSGFLSTYAGHEEAGVALAKEILPQFNYIDQDIDIVCDLIMVTKMPQRPKNLLEEIICDADLDYLGREDYPQIAESLYQELKAYDLLKDEDWQTKQIDFLEHHNFFVKKNNAERDFIKQANLAKLKSMVTAQ